MFCEVMSLAKCYAVVFGKFLIASNICLLKKAFIENVKL